MICNGFEIPQGQDLVLQPSVVEVTGGESPEAVLDFQIKPQPIDFNGTRFVFYRAYRIPTLYTWL